MTLEARVAGLERQMAMLLEERARLNEACRKSLKRYVAHKRKVTRPEPDDGPMVTQVKAILRGPFE